DARRDLRHHSAVGERDAMTRAMPIALRSIAKEARALSFAFTATVAAIVASFVFRQHHEFATFTYFIGAAAFGALSIGHEYSCRTLPLLLSQPVSRERVWLAKLGVLAVLLVVLSQIAGAVVFHSVNATESE